MNTAVWESQAIKAALTGAWKKAIELNKRILKAEPQNIAALNRLARAFLENDNPATAKKTYQKVLKIDQYNPIALKNLKRLPGKKTQTSKKNEKKSVSAVAFLEEPRKTKIVSLVRLASAQQLAEIDSGDEVLLTPKKRFIAATNQNHTYLGALPEDLSQRLIAFFKGGNRYQAFVKSIDRNHLEVIIKEIHRAARFKNRPSF